MKAHPWLMVATFLYAVPVIGVAGHRLVSALEDGVIAAQFCAAYPAVSRCCKAYSGHPAPAAAMQSSIASSP